MALPSPDATRTALVTGASSGIGSDIARELAKRGHGVTLVARRKDRLEALASEIGGQHGVRTEALSADLSDFDARSGLEEAIRELGLEVNILVNNAGFSTKGPVAKSDPAREVAMIRTDVEAVAHLCSLFLPSMVERKEGAVLNVASTGAFVPLPGQSGYGGCKAFVLSYTHGLRGELRGTGVTATTLCPGPVDTEFADTAGFDESDTTAMPQFMWLSAAEVARQAVDGLASDRPVVIPGWANKVAAAGGHLIPRNLLVGFLARQHPALRDQ